MSTTLACGQISEKSKFQTIFLLYLSTGIIVDIKDIDILFNELNLYKIKKWKAAK